MGKGGNRGEAHWRLQSAALQGGMGGVALQTMWGRLSPCLTLFPAWEPQACLAGTGVGEGTSVTSISHPWFSDVGNGGVVIKREADLNGPQSITALESVHNKTLALSPLLCALLRLGPSSCWAKGLSG